MSLIPAFNRAHDTELAKSHQQVGEGVESLLSSYLHLTGGEVRGPCFFTPTDITCHWDYPRVCWGRRAGGGGPYCLPNESVPHPHTPGSGSLCRRAG